MNTLWVTSDWHLGHRNILRYRSQFSSIEEHDEFIVQNYLRKVHNRDTVWFLGDIALSSAGLQKVAALPGYKRLVLGNHDTDRHLSVKDYAPIFTGGIFSLVRLNTFWLSHAPIHPDELRGKRNVHGHTHTRNINDLRYFNVSLENTNYSPIKLQDIRGVLDGAANTNSVIHQP